LLEGSATLDKAVPGVDLDLDETEEVLRPVAGGVAVCDEGVLALLAGVEVGSTPPFEKNPTSWARKLQRRPMDGQMRAHTVFCLSSGAMVDERVKRKDGA
jgi:hypothetical protein